MKKRKKDQDMSPIEMSVDAQRVMRQELENQTFANEPGPTYQDWRENRGQFEEPIAANPDLLSEDQAVNLKNFKAPKLFVDAQAVIDEILSFRERQVWRLVMRRGLALEETGDLLRLSPSTVKKYLKRAKTKVFKQFKENQ